MLARRSTVIVSLLALACGSPPPPPAPTTAPAPTAKAELPIDTSPVPAPPGLIVVARAAKPEALVSIVGAWTHLPLPTGPELVRTIAEDSIADLVDLAQPIDAAVTIGFSRHGVEPDGAFAVAVKDYQAARTKLGEVHKLTAGPNGQFRVEGLGFGKKRAKSSDDDDDDDACVLAPAPGGARIVCGGSSALEKLVPYLSRTMPKEKWSSDVHVEVRPEPVRGPLRELKSNLPMLASGFLGKQSPAVQSLIDASLGEAVDFIGDTQLLTLDAKVAESGVVVDTKLAFQSRKSVVAQMFTTDRGGETPAAFWHLPSDSDLAYFGRGTDPKLFDHPREILANVLLEGAAGGGMPEAERKAVKDLVADRLLPLFTNGQGIYAKGFDAAALEKASVAAKNAKPNDVIDAKLAVVQQAAGWHLYQVSEPIAKVGPILKDVGALWNKPAFAKWLQSKLDATPRIKVAPNPAGVTLPKDSVHLEVTIPIPPVELPPAKEGQKPQKKTVKPVVVHLFAIPDGGASWLAIGLDGKLAAQKAAASLATAPDANTLGKASGFEGLRDDKLNGGGFATLRGFAVLSAFDSDQSALAILNSLASKGASPIVFKGHPEGASSNAPAGTAVGTITISRAAIEDFVKYAGAKH